MFTGLLKQFLKKTGMLVAGTGVLVSVSSAGMSAVLFVAAFTTSVDALADDHNRRSSDVRISSASWDSRRNRLSVSGTADRRTTVTVFNAASGSVIDTDRSSDRGRWSTRTYNLASVPCRVRAEANGRSDERNVSNAPSNCDNGTPPPVAQCADGIDNDGDGLIDFPADPGCTDANDNDEFNAPPPPVAQCADGIDNDGDGLVDMADPGCSSPADNDETNLPPAPIPNVSINSTSANGIPGGTAVAEQPFAGQAGYTLLSINDLGMHCGDFDTRISSILPPFNVTHTHVIQKGSSPSILTPVDGIEVVYSASSNPTDPILTGINSAGTGPVYSSMLADGSVYKTNFWDVAREAYDPFYPSGILPLFYDPLANIVDLGLPMPNVERFYIDQPGFLSAEQQEMPGIVAPYVLNDPKTSKTFTTNQPFFTTFPFGYTSRNVNWFEQAGIPLTAFDDFGRENPWALMRVQAKAGGQTLASLDTVLPISGEANCGFCHGDTADGGNGAAIQALIDAGIPVASSLDDPEFGNVPLEVSKEYAADLNLVRLHDLEHGTTLEADTPVVCQTCHYTPALDLAQLGPLGPENDASVTLNGGTLPIASLANGRDQVKHKSMSNVMHGHHATVTDTNGNALFPAMPPAIDGNGNLRDATAARDVLEATCYQCHPGRRTDCLRGAMANGGMLCQDCHGDMAQVGNDFTRNVTLATPGAFDLGPDFYTNANTPRVPWANEPGCGSCHTGDVNDNMTAVAGTVDSPDGIRLMQAYKTGDAKATPIVPTNKRFAENVITAADNPNDAAAIGNPMLYRVSKGHGGVFCEACHGATHGIWPNKNPDANDNVAAMQLQGHTGTIAECSVCHGTAMDSRNTIDGPHGMHPIGENTSFARGGHENVNRNGCSACHGPGSRSSNQGTVLSAAKADRNLRGTLVRAGEPVGCTACHGNGGAD
jgi:cytochrome c553